MKSLKNQWKIVNALTDGKRKKQVFNEKSEGFDTRKVDGDVLEGDGAEAESEALQKKKMYALKAHLEHEFDSVRQEGAG